MKQIYKNNFLPFYRSEGSGSAIILIHGFMETHAVWNSISRDLAKHYKVFSVDLPGHGQSNETEGPCSIESYADAVRLLALKESLSKVFIVGHSMGGYVALAYAEKFPDDLCGLCLFHSTPFADNDTKKAARQATIEEIKQGHLSTVITRHFNSVFAENNVKCFQSVMEQAASIAGKMSEESVIASIEAMAGRKDRSELLSACPFPVICIAGKDDRLIPLSVTEELRLPKKSEIVILQHSGHMGMIEEPEESQKILNDFIDKCK